MRHFYLIERSLSLGKQIRYKMNGKNYGSKIYSLFSLVVLFIFCCEVTKAQSEPKKSPYQLPNGQYSAPTPNAIPADISFVHFDKPVFPPIPFDSAMNTGIFGEIKRTDGETQTIFYLKTEPMPEHDRIIANGTKFL